MHPEPSSANPHRRSPSSGADVDASSVEAPHIDGGTQLRGLGKPATVAGGRIRSIDLARGIAVCLMIVSHGVNGLLAFEQFADWGLVPIHAVTKFASSLFVMVFGVALGVAFVPHANTPDWPRRRRKLLLTGLTVFVWYKLLTVVELFPTHEWPQIVDALTYQAFPSYVEILGFYAIALLWIPFFLPLWARMPLALRLASPVAMTVLWFALGDYDFGGHETLQALVVEHPDHYTWGQLARGPLVLVGLLIGGALLRVRDDAAGRRRLALALAAAGVASLAVFAWRVWPQWHEALVAIAHNAGKHPPELDFMLYSVGGALVLLGLALLGGERLARALLPVTVVGSNALQAFVFHITMIFFVFRHLLEWHQYVSYGFALALSLALIAGSAVWIALLARIHRRR